MKLKFTLLSKDKLKFKIKQKWYLNVPEVIIKGTYCYDYIKYFIISIKNYNLNHSVSWNNILSLEISKNKETINYEIEDFQLYFKGQGNHLKVTNIDVVSDELTKKAKIKVNIEKVSLNKKIISYFAQVWKVC